MHSTSQPSGRKVRAMMPPAISATIPSPMPTPRTRAVSILAVIVALLGVALPAAAQSLGSPFATGAVQLLSNATTGTPCSGCKLYAFAAGTTTAQDTYIDAQFVTANANPVVLTSAGRASIFLSDRVYKFVLCGSGASGVTGVTCTGATTYWSSDYTTVIAPPMTVLTKTVNYTISALDGKDVLILCDASAGTVTVSLYTAVGNAGRKISVKKTDTSTNSCTLDANGSQTIDGALTASMANQYQNVEIVSDNANWLTLGIVDRSVVPGTCTCRLTLTSGTGVTTAPVSLANRLYLTPYLGTRVTLYNGSIWVLYALSEVEANLTNAPFNVASGSNYDVFLYSNSGVLTLEFLVWTNGTTRATALTTQDGALVKSGALTRLYVGTIRGSGVNAVSKTLLQQFVWNQFNRRRSTMQATETADSWTYNVATWRQARATAANKVEAVIGLDEEPVSATILAHTTGGSGKNIAVGLDSITVPTSGGFIGSASGSTQARAELVSAPGIGYHYWAWLEYDDTGGATWYGDNGTPTLLQSGLQATLWN